MNEVLLPIGTVAKVEPQYDYEEAVNYMIIGNRIINHESFRCWDYIGVPYPVGMKREFSKSSNGIKHGENFFYFNHTDILEIIREMNTVESEEDRDEI
ncbi:DUF4176 domain-containing protein [Bacillus cereus group sp. TH152-1LC]|uniref:DUF4176 domain-containing protein n=1 Tax=Bacillus cereus group sp. TH152-1LC TaxID=3018060 RepID=UPI0022E22FBD|nr:DUF4176 domain-containing protein [Bacillus cereus group sp. TH152-1LC]MDA1675648.1 DUF4176 domain-containing protein [Bacillus cereus group sp. TH152-1LC]